MIWYTPLEDLGDSWWEAVLDAYNIADSDAGDFPSYVGANVSVSSPCQNNLVSVMYAVLNTKRTHAYIHTFTYPRTITSHFHPLDLIPFL